MLASIKIMTFLLFKKLSKKILNHRLRGASFGKENLSAENCRLPPSVAIFKERLV